MFLTQQKNPLAGPNPPNRTGGATALELCACLNPADGPRATPVREVLSPSFRARIGLFGSAAAIKCTSRLAHFVAAALPNIPIRAAKLGDRTSLTGVARGPLEGLRCTRSLIAVVPPVRFGRVSQGACLKVFFGCWAISAGGARAFYGGGAPKSPCARPQTRR